MLISPACPYGRDIIIRNIILAIVQISIKVFEWSYQTLRSVELVLGGDHLDLDPATDRKPA